MKRGPARTPIDLDVAQRLIAAGCTRDSIARHLGVSRLTARKRLKEAGVEHGRSGRPRLSPPPPHPAQVLAPESPIRRCPAHFGEVEPCPICSAYAAAGL